MRSATFVCGLAALAGCNSQPPTPRPAAVLRPDPVNVSQVAADLSAVGKELSNSPPANPPVSNPALGAALNKLGSDLPNLGANLKLLGPIAPSSLNRYFLVPNNFDNDLARIGADLAAPAPAADLKTLGDEISKPKPDPSSLAADQNNLATHLAPLGGDLIAAASSLSGNSQTLNADIAPVSVPPAKLSADFRSLGTHLASPPPPGANPGDSLSSLSGDLLNLASDTMPPLTNEPSVPFRFYASFGSTFQSPYTISYDPTKQTARLTNAGNSTVFSLEFSYFDRYILRPDKSSITLGSNDDSWRWTLGDSRPFTEKLRQLVYHPDFEFHIGFLLGTGANSTNIPASTIAGGGNYYTDTSLGFPLARRRRTDLIEQFSLEFSGGVSTDEQLMAVHPNFLASFGYENSFFAPSFLAGGEKTPAFVVGKVGYGFVDVPYLSSPSENLNVKVTDLPQFVRRGAPAVETYFAYPLATNSYLLLRANAYALRNPTPWNISASLTIGLDNISKIFGLK